MTRIGKYALLFLFVLIAGYFGRAGIEYAVILIEGRVP